MSGPTVQRVDMTPFLGKDFRDFVLWFFLSAITSADNETRTATKKIFDSRSEEDKKAGIYHVEFRVEGVDLPFVETLREMEAQFQEMTIKKAQELVEGQMGERLDNFYELIRQFERDCKEKLNFSLEE